MANIAKTAVEKTALTNWKAFVDAGLVPTQIRCDGYFPKHPTNEGCHSALVPTGQAMINHLKAEHGGGFFITFRRTDGSKPWTGWQELQDAGIEISDFRCAVCNEQIALDPRHILQHMNPHKNGNRRTQEGKIFWMTITDKPVEYEFKD